MKNIFEDDTLPSGAEIPKVSVPDRKTDLPVRPKRQVTPPPGQQVRQAVQPPEIATPAQTPAPAVQNAYQYVPVNPSYPNQPQAYPQQGVVYYPVLDQNGQPVYPQQTVYPKQVVYPQQVPYVSYGTYPQAPQPAQPMQDTPAKEDFNPGTRVLYQSPDFENKDGSKFSGNVGASFADSVKTSDEEEKEDTTEDTAEGLAEESKVDFEEVSIDKIRKPVIKRASAPPPIVSAHALSPEDIYKNEETGDISFAAYNAVNHSMDVEEFEQELPAYVDEDVEEVDIDSGEKKALPRNEIIRRSVLAVAIVAIVISVGMLLNEWRLSIQNDSVMEEAEGLIITQQTVGDEDGKKDKDKTTTKPLTPEEQWAQIKADYPNVLFPANIQLKYAKLYGENQDFVGYLSADGVKLNLPVVQADDDETYLNKNFYGAKTKYGCPFVTHLNNMSYNHLDMNTVIFGHHMNNGTIFGALDKYKTLAGYKSAPIISFNTLYKDYQWKVIAAFITNGYASGDNGYIFPYYFTNLSSASKMTTYLNELAQRSLYDTGVDVLPSDKLLTLSTCSHEFEDARFVVVARLVRPGEKAVVDTSVAVVNSKPRYPQAYYSKKGTTNPYKNASRWFAT